MIELSAAERARRQATKELQAARKVIRNLQRELLTTQKQLNSHREARLRFLIGMSLVMKESTPK
jgi:hypothetical protein